MINIEALNLALSGVIDGQGDAVDMIAAAHTLYPSQQLFVSSIASTNRPYTYATPT